MSTVNQRYLKDENGNVFSPVTSAKSVFINRGNAASTVEEAIPYTYKIDSGDTYRNQQIIFDGNVSDWTMVKVYLTVLCSDSTTSKAVFLRINDTDCTGNIFEIDARCRDNGFSYYNPESMKPNIFVGDVAYTGNTSYMEIIILNKKGVGWHPFKTVVGNASGTNGKYSLSLCSGQLAHANMDKSLTQLKLITTQGIKVDGILQIFT